jgi:probable phosphoglycerate mutase
MEGKMLRIYITRHGETEWNIEKRMQGWNDSPLTAKGIEDAIALGYRLKNVDLKCVYTSPSGRAMKTSELIIGNRDIAIIPEENLREIHLGEWEGKTALELDKADKVNHNAFWEAPHLYVPNNGESFLDVRERISNILKRIIDENENGEIMIVTHAVIVKTIMSIFKGLEVEKLWEQPFIMGTSLSVIEVESEDVRVLFEGDTSHITKYT